MNNGNAPKTETIPDSTLLDDFFPPRFLTVKQFEKWDLAEIRVTIAEIQSEDVFNPMSGTREMLPVLYLRTKTGQTHEQGYLLKTITDKDALKTACNAERVGELIGKPIRIYKTTWRGNPVLRIDKMTPAPQKPETPEPREMD